ncbi:coagulation factor XII-like isoform X2 [Amphibalanus amphitrite]|uniref:coagulation factor XII-like isoform X2 n=1 Tax=Amphibalanus amphitrite TaxID=1232801 RepID=UPI001C914E87|nr:coagulation factor XII-like isoform X2 [Amphibalanus amphitrite]
MDHQLVLVVLVTTLCRITNAFTTAEVPTPRFTYEPDTIHVEIPKLPGMSLAAIHLTLNEPVHGTQPGKINKDLALVGDTFKTTVHLPWQTNDVIFYWVYVIVDGLGYQRLGQRHVIRATNAGPPPRGPFQVPSPMFHLTPHVITVTVPALPGISLVAIHLSLNEPVPGTRPGRYNQDLERSGDVFTTMVVADWKAGDTIHYWLYVVYEGLGRHRLAQQFVIDADAAGGTPSRPGVPATPPPAVSSQLPEQCGSRFFDQFGDFSLRVSGGTPVSTFDYPWQAQIQTTRSTHVCGGIIISDRHILTAAHCLSGHLTRDLQVVVGQNDLTKKDEEEEVFAVKQSFSHVGFGEEGAGRYSNDIAVLLLRTGRRGPIVFGDHVRPACLPPPNDISAEFTACLVSGWGATDTERRPNVLHGTEVPYVSSDFCSSPEVWGALFNGTGQLCAGDTAGGRDSCGGDSGGPLACRDASGRWLAAGIVSWGSDDCGQTVRVGVYTRVSAYVPWIVYVIDNVFEFSSG